jgi:radical SAM superfamily enzyme YgiQ (UPF0313 family)
MTHAIIFTDQAPNNRMYDDIKFTNAFYSYPAGAYKIASVLRSQGLTVLVVPNCLSLSFLGVQKIIQQNSKDLLWVGISTTFLTVQSSKVNDYRQQWHQTKEWYLGTDLMFSQDADFDTLLELAWHTKEIGKLSHWLERSHNVPLLIGGSWVSRIQNGNLNHLHSNTHVIKGYAESWISKFTKDRLQNKKSDVSFLISNNHYDDVDFKQSQILWTNHDYIQPSDWLPLEISRGCAFNCHYCDFPRRSNFDSYKDPAVLRQELIKNYETFGVTSYLLVDDLYNDSKDKVRRMYDEVWSRLPFRPEWASYMRLDMFWADPDSIEIVKASGARIGSFGIETLDDRSGKGVGKGLGKKRILETLTALKQSWGTDTLVCANFIAGLPLESIDSIQESMAWTESTDLIYSYVWNPLGISSKAKLLIKTDKEYIDQISRDNDKYSVKWLSDTNWINQHGVTWEQVSSLVTNHMSKVPYGVKLGYTDYVDLRTAGLSHQAIVGLKDYSTPKESLVKSVDYIRKRIKERLTSVINTVV